MAVAGTGKGALRAARAAAIARAGSLIAEAQANLCPTAGTCMVMGTASTMACVTEALGMMVPGGATAPSATGRRLQIVARTGRLAVELAATGRRPSAILDRRSFRNAVTALIALGGSTNAVIHLTAIAQRAGFARSLDDVDRIARVTPLLVDCKPNGSGYLEDLDRAGGMPVLLRYLLDAGLLDAGAATVTGATLGEVLADASQPGARPPADPSPSCATATWSRSTSTRGPWTCWSLPASSSDAGRTGSPRRCRHAAGGACTANRCCPPTSERISQCSRPQCTSRGSGCRTGAERSWLSVRIGCGSASSAADGSPI